MTSSRCWPSAVQQPGQAKCASTCVPYSILRYPTVPYGSTLQYPAVPSSTLAERCTAACTLTIQPRRLLTLTCCRSVRRRTERAVYGALGGIPERWKSAPWPEQGALTCVHGCGRGDPSLSTDLAAVAAVGHVRKSRSFPRRFSASRLSRESVAATTSRWRAAHSAHLESIRPATYHMALSVQGTTRQTTSNHYQARHSAR